MNLSIDQHQQAPHVDINARIVGYSEVEILPVSPVFGSAVRYDVPAGNIRVP